MSVNFDVFVSEVLHVPMLYLIPKLNTRPQKSRLDSNTSSFTITELYKLLDLWPIKVKIMLQKRINSCEELLEFYY